MKALDLDMWHTSTYNFFMVTCLFSYIGYITCMPWSFVYSYLLTKQRKNDSFMLIVVLCQVNWSDDIHDGRRPLDVLTSRIGLRGSSPIIHSHRDLRSHSNIQHDQRLHGHRKTKNNMAADKRIVQQVSAHLCCRNPRTSHQDKAQGPLGAKGDWRSATHKTTWTLSLVIG